MLEFDEIELNFSEVNEWYAKARAIALKLGANSPDSPDRYNYKGNRLDISCYSDSALLVILFDDRAHTGKPYYSEVLNIASQGSIIHLRRAHLSEKEAGEGRSDSSFLPWYNWLERTYRTIPVESQP